MTFLDRPSVHRASREQDDLLGDGLAADGALLEGLGTLLAGAVSAQEGSVFLTLHADVAELGVLQLLHLLLQFLNLPVGARVG